MTRKKTIGEASASTARPAPRRQVLATACAIALFATTSANAQQATEQTQEAQQTEEAQQAQQQPAAAQQEPDISTLQAVQVTGIRAAIATAVETKQESTSIVEAVSAEDLGKLPDVSIAESISRLPGLAAQRVNGRAQVIAIRGLAPDFATTLLNGREQVTTGDNRGVEFDQFPSELISAVTVYKTPDASLIGQGLSGTVNMQTLRPLSFSERQMNVNVRGERNSFGELNDGTSATGNRISASYVDQFADGTIGIALGIAHLDSPFQEKHYKAWWWGGSASWFPADGIPGKPAGAEMLMGAEVWARSADQKRDGIMGVFEFKPNDKFHSVLDLYYSKFEQDETMRGIMWSQDPWTGNGVTITDPIVARSGTQDVVVGGTVNNLEPIVRNDHNTRKDYLLSAGWNNEWKFAEGWSLIGDLSYSTTRRKQMIAETYAGIENVGTDGSVTPTLDSAIEDTPLGSDDFARFTFGQDYADPSRVLLSDPAGWGHDGRIERPRLEDTIKAARLELNHDLDFGPFVGWDLGINFSKRVKEKTSAVFFANLLNGRTPVPVDSDLLDSSTDLGFAGIDGVLAYDVDGALARYYDVTLNMSGDDFRKDYSVTEEVRTLYSKLDIDTDIGETRLRGNVGLQWVHTDQSSKGFNVRDVNNLGTVESGDTYNTYLPSLNLVGDFGDGWFIRFGAAKTLARGRIDDMRAASSAGVSPTTRMWGGNGGNPSLKPWIAKAADLSFEKYFGDGNYVALALFYKNLDNYIRTQTVSYDFTGYTNPDPEIVPISNIGSFSTPVNAKGGYIRGVELSTALDFGQMTSVLDGFGAQFNASYTETNVNPNNSEDANNPEINKLPGFSRDVANLTLYYEKNGFAARIAERYRSKYRGEVYSLFFSRSFTTVLPERLTDLQLSYEFGEGSSLKGLSLLFQVNNLTNEAYRTEQNSVFPGGGAQPLEFNEYGRQFLIGANYKF